MDSPANICNHILKGTDEQRLHCLLCYKPASRPFLENDSRDYQNELTQPAASGEDKINFFQQFYQLLCVIQASSKLEKPYQHTNVEATKNASVCDDCFLVIRIYCQLDEEIKNLQRNLKKQLSTLRNIMKCASKVQSRVKSFKESFHYQFQDSNGDLIVTIKQGQMDKTLECRQRILNACSESLLEEVPISVSINNTTLNSTGSIHLNTTNEETLDVNVTGDIEDDNGESQNSDSGDDHDHDDHEDDVDENDDGNNADNTLSYVAAGRGKRMRLENSMDENTAPPPTYPCPKEKCLKTFINQESLDTHLFEHGHFSCIFCKFVTEHAKNLIDHEIQFHGSKSKVPARKVRCPRCKKLIGDSNFDRARHYFPQHLGLGGIASVKCTVCEKVFTGWRTSTAQSKLTRHFKRHLDTNNTSFRCPDCGVGLSNKSSFELHSKNLHPNRDDLFETLINEQNAERITVTPTIMKEELSTDDDDVEVCFEKTG